MRRKEPEQRREGLLLAEQHNRAVRLCGQQPPLGPRSDGEGGTAFGMSSVSHAVEGKFRKETREKLHLRWLDTETKGTLYL